MQIKVNGTQIQKNTMSAHENIPKNYLCSWKGKYLYVAFIVVKYAIKTERHTGIGHGAFECNMGVYLIIKWPRNEKFHYCRYLVYVHNIFDNIRVCSVLTQI